MLLWRNPNFAAPLPKVRSPQDLLIREQATIRSKLDRAYNLNAESIRRISRGETTYQQSLEIRETLEARPKDHKDKQPSILDPADAMTPATPGDNIRDNVEQIVIPSPVSGTYTLKISHKGSLKALNLITVPPAGTTPP
jgi:hypothetical protein